MFRPAAAVTFNPHSPFSLQFEVNKDGHVPGAPPDTFLKSGAGGFCLYVVPSLYPGCVQNGMYWAAGTGALRLEIW